MMLSKTAQKALDAYGGIELWQKAKYIEAEISADGWAFFLKRRKPFKHAKIYMEVERPFSKLTPIGKNKHLVGVLNGEHVALENEKGETIAERKYARNYFPYGRRLLFWDDLDMAYFANYAFWNYFTLPKLLMHEAIEWTEKSNGILMAKFPDSLPTHSKVQEFHFDTETGLLLQHHYTADIISPFAKAANRITSHAKNNAFVYPNSRIVTPRSTKGTALNSPVLIDIKVHQLNINSRLP